MKGKENNENDLNDLLQNDNQNNKSLQENKNNISIEKNGKNLIYLISDPLLKKYRRPYHITKKHKEFCWDNIYDKIMSFHSLNSFKNQSKTNPYIITRYKGSGNT